MIYKQISRGDGLGFLNEFTVVVFIFRLYSTYMFVREQTLVSVSQNKLELGFNPGLQL